MSRGTKIALFVLLGIVVALGGILVVMRSMQDGADAPVEVAPGILRARNAFSDIYGARKAGGVVLFDAGLDPTGRAIAALVTSLGMRLEDVRDVYLTHAHFDHIAGSRVCPNARVHAGAGDAELAGLRVASPKIMVRLLMSVWPIDPVIVTDALNGTIEDAATGVVSYPMPGHTPGSYAYWLDGVLFVGDSIHIEEDRLVGAAPQFSIDMAENARSIVALGRALVGRRLDLICSGHEACTPPGRARAMLDDLVVRAGAPPAP